MSLQDDVRTLAEIVPRPPGTDLPDGADEFMIDEFTDETGITVPPELSEWLEFTNGPLIGQGGVFGLETDDGQAQDIVNVLDRIPAFASKKLIPIAGDGCGNYYALETLNLNLRPVYFFDAYDGYESPNYTVASELWRFLWFMFNRELTKTGWPFDKTYVTTHDPCISNVQTATLPWDTD